MKVRSARSDNDLIVMAIVDTGVDKSSGPHLEFGGKLHLNQLETSVNGYGTYMAEHAYKAFLLLHFIPTCSISMLICLLN